MTAITPTGFASFSPAAYRSYTSKSAVRADAVYNQTSDIVIHTLEGDRVTLSSSTYNVGGYETYESLSKGDGRVIYQYSEATYFRSRQQMNIAVTGDLNKEELKDIDRILGTLNDILNDFSLGNLEGALKRSSRFSGIDAIASFSADLNFSLTYTESRFETEPRSMFVSGAEGGEGDAIRDVLRSADSISQVLKTWSFLLEHLAPVIEKYLSKWTDPTDFISADRSKDIKWSQLFARRLLESLKPDMPHEWRIRNRGSLKQDGSASVPLPQSA